MPQLITRFAPSPTGYLHKGHAYSALMAYDLALQSNGRFILRIEDIDPIRCKPEYTQAIYQDLNWLGITWETPVRIQSEHLPDYQQALNRLNAMGLLYPCFCTRADIQREATESTQAPHLAQAETSEIIYTGNCRTLTAQQRATQITANKPYCWRLNMSKALNTLENSKKELIWHDTIQGEIKAHPETFGDVVLARKDVPTSYHLSVVTDDALQGINHIVRGVDLFRATDIHCLLQALLNLPTPTYTHHPLLTDESGIRYAKRHKSETLKSLQESNISPEFLRKTLFKT